MPVTVVRWQVGLQPIGGALLASAGELALPVVVMLLALRLVANFTASGKFKFECHGGLPLAVGPGVPLALALAVAVTEAPRSGRMAAHYYRVRP